MKHLESLFERALDAVVGMDKSGKVIAWNKAAEEIFGWTRKEAIGANMGDLIVPEQHRKEHTRGLEHYNRTGEGPVLQKRVRITALHRSGHEFPVELSIFPMSDESRADTFYAFVRSRELEEVISREQALRAEEGKALMSVAQKLCDDVSFGEFTQFCLETVCSVARLDAGHLFVVRGTGTGARLFPTNIWHLTDPRFSPVIEATNDLQLARGEGLPGQAWEARELQAIDDVSSCETFLRQNVFTKVGLTRAVALPVWQADQLHGVLEFFGTSEARLDSDVRRLIRTIGSQIGVAIVRKEEAEYRETLRSEISHRVGNSLTVLSSIYRSCSRLAKTKEDLDRTFLGHLMAVARAHRLAVEHSAAGARLSELLNAALEILPNREEVKVEAAEFIVQRDSVMPLALVLSELATNMIKHNEGGPLTIRVRRATSSDKLILEWIESFGSGRNASRSLQERTGFGTKLLRIMIEEKLAGRFDRQLTETGLRMIVELPRTRVELGP